MADISVNQRIMQIMQKGSYSKTSFASLLGISQPILSHLSSGRNKASLEIVQKLLEAFPDINPSWLLTGKGQMYLKKDESNAEKFRLQFEGFLFKIQKLEEQLQELKKAAEIFSKELKGS